MAPKIVDPSLLIRLQLLGREFKNFKSYKLDSSFMTPTDGWEAVVFEEDRKKLRGLELQPVELLINGHQQLLGRIEVTNIGGNGTAMTLRGRDYLADFGECNVDPALKLKKETTLDQALELLLGPLGVDTIIDEADVLTRELRAGKSLGGKSGKKHKKKKLDDLKPEPGQGVLDFTSKLLARFGATLQPAPDRRAVALEAPNYKQAPAYRIIRTADAKGSSANTVLSAEAIRDYTRLPTVALFSGSTGSTGDTKSRTSVMYDMVTFASGFNEELSRVLDVIHERSGKDARRKPGDAAGLGDGRLYRLLYHRDENAKNQEQLENAAKRAIAERLKDTLSYRVKVRGFDDPESGALWAINTMVQVDDDICDIHEPLWIESRSFSHSPDQGAVTELECWRSESFQIGND